MIHNTRHVPGSIRSCGFAFSLNATLARRLKTVREKSVQNPYKSDHVCECEFFNASTSTTYSLTALKWTDFIPFHLILILLLILISIDPTPGFAAPPTPRHRRQFQHWSHYSHSSHFIQRGKPILQHCIKLDKTGRFGLLPKTNHAVPTTYDDTSRARPIFQFHPR